MRTHRLDPVSLVFGLAYTALAVVGLADGLSLAGPDLRLLGPAVLVLLGLALLLSTARGRREGAGRDNGSAARASVAEPEVGDLDDHR